MQTVATAGLASLIDKFVQIALALVVHNFGSGNQNDVRQSVIRSRSSPGENLALITIGSVAHQSADLQNVTVLDSSLNVVDDVLDRNETGTHVSTEHVIGTHNTISHNVYPPI